MPNDNPGWITRRTADDGYVSIESTDILSAQRAMFEARSPEEMRRISIAQVAERLRPWWEPMKNNPWGPRRARRPTTRSTTR